MNNLRQLKVLNRYFRRWFHETIDEAVWNHLNQFNNVAEKYDRKHRKYDRKHPAGA